MSVDKFNHILNLICNFTNYVYLHVKGEPLLHQNLDEILDLCRNYDINVVVVTNGSLLSQKQNILLSKSAVKQVNISLHCYADLPDVISKERYLSGVFDFVKSAIAESTITISLRLWNKQPNHDKTSDIESIIHQRIEEVFGLSYRLTEKIVPRKGFMIADRVWLNSDLEFQWPSLNSPYLGNRGTCMGLRNQIAVLCNGKVVPCCLDSEGIIDLGNIFKTDLTQILADSRVKRIIKGFENNQKIESLCQRCNFFDKFN